VNVRTTGKTISQGSTHRNPAFIEPEISEPDPLDSISIYANSAHISTHTELIQGLFQVRLMAKPVSLWPVAAETHFNPSPVRVGFVLDKEAWESFYTSTSVSPCQYKCKNIPCSFVYQRHHIISAIGRIENCAVLGYNAPCSCISLRTFRDNISVPSLRVKDS